MHRFLGLFLPALLCFTGCSGMSMMNNGPAERGFRSEPTILMSYDLDWDRHALVEHMVSAEDVRNVPYLPPIRRSDEMIFSQLTNVLVGTGSDGMPQLRVPPGYSAVVWREGSVVPNNNDYVGWVQVFAYPNDWQARAQRGLHSRDIGWAFLRRTQDLRGWQDATRIFPCETWRAATPEEQSAAQSDILGRPRPTLWRRYGGQQGASRPVATSCRRPARGHDCVQH